MADLHITQLHIQKTIKNNRTSNRRMENETAKENTRSNSAHIPTPDAIFS